MKAVFAVVMLAAACGASDPATCSWPLQYDRTDAGVAGGCVAERYWLRCTDGQPSSTVSCLSAERDSCTPSTDGMGTTTDCTSQCHDDEYAIECGLTSTAMPPSACRSLNPVDGTLVCCRCGS